MPLLKESLWGGLCQAILSLFHFLVVVVASTWQESQIGVATLIGSELLNNFLQLGILLLVAKQTIYLNPWISIRDAIIVITATIIFIAFVFFEGSPYIGILFFICLLVYWVLEVLSKIISEKVA